MAFVFEPVAIGFIECISSNAYKSLSIPLSYALCLWANARASLCVMCVYVKTALVQTSTRRTAATRCLLPLHIIICILCVRVMSHPQHALMHFSSHSLSLVSGLVASVRARENGVRMKRETNKWLRTECRFSTKHSINKFAEHHRFHIFSLFFVVVQLYFEVIFHSHSSHFPFM